ncbi:MAG: iron chelate uptake ABC transporter family permease subunit [Myxococcota bacterium]
MAEFWQRTVDFATFEYAFARDALLVSILVGALCGFVGVFLVLRRLSLLGDATGHATLPGVVLAYMLFGSARPSLLLLGALATALAAAGSINVILRAGRAREDAAIGVVLAVFFGLGIVLLSTLQSNESASQAGLSAFLLGNAAAVTGEQIVIIAGAAVLLTTASLVAYRPLTLAVFDPVYASTLGFSVPRIHGALVIGVAVTVVVSVQAVGAILVTAMLILPPSAALLLTRRLPLTLIVSTLFGALSGALGAYGSFLLEGFGTGPTMVLAATLVFAFALLRRAPVAAAA